MARAALTRTFLQINTGVVATVGAAADAAARLDGLRMIVIVRLTLRAMMPTASTTVPPT